MKKILLIPFFYCLPPCLWRLAEAILMSRSLQNSPNSRKIRVAVMIPTIIPTRLPPGGNGRYLVLLCFPARNNTERVAQLIQTTLDCDILEVEPETAYDNDYTPCWTLAGRAGRLSVRATILRSRLSLENFDDYDIVFVGYPIWYSSMATSMQTFLHEHAAKLAGNESHCSPPAAAAVSPHR